MAQTLVRPGDQSRTALAIVDCDIHNALPSEQTLRQYLPARWRAYHEQFGSRGYAGGAYPKAAPNAARTDSWPPSGQPPGSDLPFLREQLLDAWGIEYGILNCLASPTSRHLEFGVAAARAINDWQIAEWLEPEPRLRASIVVPLEDGAASAVEIDRLGDDRRFVQVILTVRTSEPLGRRKYWPIYEAAARHDLPVGIHFGGGRGHALTGAGWPSFYIEDHTGMAQSFQDQVISLVCEGVFERFPTLKVVLIEGGFAWLPPLLWRLDRAWRRLRDEAPHLRRLPSEYVRDQVWVTTQPMEEPTRPEQFHQLLEHLDLDDHILFATDYPHWDFDAPDQAFPVKLAPALHRKIVADNARALYRL